MLLRSFATGGSKLGLVRAGRQKRRGLYSNAKVAVGHRNRYWVLVVSCAVGEISCRTRHVLRELPPGPRLCLRTFFSSPPRPTAFSAPCAQQLKVQGVSSACTLALSCCKPSGTGSHLRYMVVVFGYFAHSMSFLPHFGVCSWLFKAASFEVFK